ncbi:GrpB family protein [Bradyrhizobium cenepequi]|uniref:GrpB family protein n=1 Tax=Bradyrhizobium cenepequi TaxID=2821403 RepID=UPI001CE2E8FE|nr:GrpB family protein [Bradyrhizobium cenepequi]MCA6108961.1 GrpB family protein [Bradyrhizobium cenepequi]
MPPPIKVELLPHSPGWSHLADAEAQLLAGAFGPNLRTVHHIGSTAIPGIRAKPILDLMPVISNLAGLDECQGKLEALGYDWWGELGLPGRRYCTKSDPKTGRRTVQLHCYEDGSTEITRHLAFRDCLRAHPTLAAEYDRVKVECQRRHPNDSHAYGDCKEAWIRNGEAAALEWYQAS